MVDVVIGITGLPCSGKTTLTKAILEVALKNGIPAISLSMSELLREFHKYLTFNFIEGSLLEVGQYYRKRFCPHFLAQIACERIKALDLPFLELAVVDGLRGKTEYETFARNFNGYWRYGGKFFLVYIIEDEKTRFERSKKRGRKDDAINLEDFRKRDQNSFEQSVLEAQKLNDMVVSGGEPKTIAWYVLWSVNLLGETKKG